MSDKNYLTHDYLKHGYQPHTNNQPKPQSGYQPSTGILSNPPDRGSSIQPPAKDKK